MAKLLTGSLVDGNQLSLENPLGPYPAIYIRHPGASVANFRSRRPDNPQVAGSIHRRAKIAKTRSNANFSHRFAGIWDSVGVAVDGGVSGNLTLIGDAVHITVITCSG